MEAVLFIGLQASGKSSFYLERFFATHVRISLDLLKTRYREKLLLTACLEAKQPFAVDNTNPTLLSRAPYIRAARLAKFALKGYYFRSKVEDCLARNRARKTRVPDVGILATAKKLQRPSLSEGFDSLHYVQLTHFGFVEENWNDEL